MALSILQIAINGFDDNFSYLIHNTVTKEAAYIDPTGDTELVADQVAKHNLSITAIWVTHTHFDHTDKLPEVMARYLVPVWVHERGLERIESQQTETFTEGSVLKLGDAPVTVLHTPGHLDDSVCFYSEETDGPPLLIAGDTLFVGGCGRTNEQDIHDLYESLQRLKTLPPETVVYPGHDYGSTPTSTIEHELEHNKYLLAENFEAFRKLRLG